MREERGGEEGRRNSVHVHMCKWKVSLGHVSYNFSHELLYIRFFFFRATSVFLFFSIYLQLDPGVVVTDSVLLWRKISFYDLWILAATFTHAAADRGLFSRGSVLVGPTQASPRFADVYMHDPCVQGAQSPLSPRPRPRPRSHPCPPPLFPPSSPPHGLLVPPPPTSISHPHVPPPCACLRPKRWFYMIYGIYVISIFLVPVSCKKKSLFLNVWMPPGARTNSKLPVMVWLFGGGFQQGASSHPEYDGKRLAEKGASYCCL